MYITFLATTMCFKNKRALHGLALQLKKNSRVNLTTVAIVHNVKNIIMKPVENILKKILVLVLKDKIVLLIKSQNETLKGFNSKGAKKMMLP